MKPSQKHNLLGVRTLDAYIKDDASSWLDIQEYHTMGRLDSSFKSFVNSVDTHGDGEPNFEVVFHNEALFKILGEKSYTDMTALINKAIFKNQ